MRLTENLSAACEVVRKRSGRIYNRFAGRKKAFAFRRVLLAAFSMCIFLPSDAAALETFWDGLTVNGELRVAYLHYDHKSEYGHTKNIFRGVRSSASINYAFDAHNRISVGGMDSRVFDDHGLDKPLYLYRAYLSSQYENFGMTLGRQGHTESDDYVIYAQSTFLDGAKFRIGPRSTHAEFFAGGIGKGPSRSIGFWGKAFVDRERFRVKSALFSFSKIRSSEPWNRQLIWNNAFTLKITDELSLQYDRLNYWGENYGRKSDHQSGYVIGLAWNNLDISKPNTFWISATYTHQPQGSFFNHVYMANVAAFDWTYPQSNSKEALGFKGPGLYIGYTICRNLLFNIEAYSLKNIYGTPGKYRQKTASAYLCYLF